MIFDEWWDQQHIEWFANFSPVDLARRAWDAAIEHKFSIGDTLQDEDGNTGQVVIHWNDGDNLHFINDINHQNPKVVGNINDQMERG